MDKLFTEFLMEKEYVAGLSKVTLQGYRVTWRTFKRIIREPAISREAFFQFVKVMLEEGLQSKTINNHITVINSFLTWAKENGHNPDNLRIKKIKTDKKVQPCYTNDELLKIVRWKPLTWPQKRLQVMLLTLMDTGCRIDEMLTLERRNVDFENMFITVRGKGNKQRIIPMSIELRKRLFPYSKTHYFNLFFPSRTGLPLNYDNCLSDLKTMCFKIKVPYKAFHGFRRAFARGFVKNGGDVFTLQKILGHESIETTRIYVDLNPEELKEIHLRSSILSHLR
jgi:site-specific recombinase XerD